MHLLDAIYQRTQSESKSQLCALTVPLAITGCNLSKNTIWKQITTTCRVCLPAGRLDAIYQRTQSESKSQHRPSPALGYGTGCNLSKNTIWKQITTMWMMVSLRVYWMQSIKEHNLKANHNSRPRGSTFSSTGCNLSKNTPDSYRDWKQITTVRIDFPAALSLDAIYQRTQSESKSQLELGDGLAQLDWMQSIKEHNLKANHNDWEVHYVVNHTGCNLSKNTIWKQITTVTLASRFTLVLDAIYQRTQSESKSQRPGRHTAAVSYWMQSIKEHNLKANHNLLSTTNSACATGCNLSKNTPDSYRDWKQITTSSHHFISCQSLDAIYQRTQSESKSQPSRSHLFL